MQAPPRPWKWQLEHDAYDGSVSLSDWKARPFFWHALTGKRRFAAAAALMLAFAAAGWVMSERNGLAWRQSKNVVMTGIGENRTLELADGSQVTLGGNTRLTWSYTDRERSFELARGEALFKVASEASRPFQVRAGDASVIALGTAFNVRRASDHTVVAVTDGRVLVEPVAHLLPLAVLREFRPRLRPVHVDAGEQTTAGSAGIERVSRMDDVYAATSWQTGHLSFRLQPLRYVLEDVNRYAKKPIVAADDHVAALVFSGTIIEDNVSAWVQSLERAFGLVAIEESDRVVLSQSDRSSPLRRKPVPGE
jgi:transmembrane sensor